MHMNLFKTCLITKTNKPMDVHSQFSYHKTLLATSWISVYPHLLAGDGGFQWWFTDNGKEHLAIPEGFPVQGKKGRKNIAKEEGGNEIRDFMVWDVFIVFSRLSLK